MRRAGGTAASGVTATAGSSGLGSRVASAFVSTIGRDAHLPVQISHVKLAMHGLWGQAGKLVEVLDRARAAGVNVTADIYPYPYWHSGITVLFPNRDFANRAEARNARRRVGAMPQVHDSPSTCGGFRRCDAVSRLSPVARRSHCSRAQPFPADWS